MRQKLLECQLRDIAAFVVKARDFLQLHGKLPAPAPLPAQQSNSSQSLPVSNATLSGHIAASNSAASAESVALPTLEVSQAAVSGIGDLAVPDKRQEELELQLQSQMQQQTPASPHDDSGEEK